MQYYGIKVIITYSWTSIFFRTYHFLSTFTIRWGFQLVEIWEPPMYQRWRFHDPQTSHQPSLTYIICYPRYSQCLECNLHQIYTISYRWLISCVIPMFGWCNLHQIFHQISPNWHMEHPRWPELWKKNTSIPSHEILVGKLNCCYPGVVVTAPAKNHLVSPITPNQSTNQQKQV